MGSPLTNRAPLTELADRWQHIETKGIVQQLPRLAAALAKDFAKLPAEVQAPSWRQYPVTITLRFGWADERREYVSLEGEAAARIGAICQRCLEPFDLELRTALKLLLIRPGDAVAERPGYEAWELEEPNLRPIDIVDEALVMAMPLAPRHETECRAVPRAMQRDEGATTRPFADLRSRLRDTE